MGKPASGVPPGALGSGTADHRPGRRLWRGAAHASEQAPQHSSGALGEYRRGTPPSAFGWSTMRQSRQSPRGTKIGK